MGRIGGVVQLMVGRAHEHAAPDAGERDPDLAVLKLGGQIDVKQHQDVLVEQRERHRLAPKRILGRAADQADDEREVVGEDQRIERMDAEIDQRRQHFSRMVGLVQFP